MAAMRAGNQAAGDPDGPGLACAALAILHAPFLPPTQDERLQHDLQDVSHLQPHIELELTSYII